MEKKSIQLENHPCFNEGACHDHRRIHLPVAPKCNVQCGFCNRKYDCVNESRPGVTSSLLSPGQAQYYLKRSLEQNFFDVVGIAGPGDPFANGKETMETLKRVHQDHPEIMLCTASNGLEIRPYISQLAENGVTHVTLTISAVDPNIAGQVYRWIRYKKRVYKGVEAGKIIIKEQLDAIKALKKEGILVKINSIIIPGVNDHHLEEVAKVVSALGADTMNCLPLLPVEGTDFGHLEHPPHQMTQSIRKACREHLPQMGHCRRCRADAVGLLGESTKNSAISLIQEAAALPRNPEEYRPYIAVTSREGVLINLHLGQAAKAYIFNRDGNFIEERALPAPGGSQQRWEEIGETLQDCQNLLCSGIGATPLQTLEDRGIKVEVIEGMIPNAISHIKNGEPLAYMAVRKGCCTGASQGCA